MKKRQIWNIVFLAAFLLTFVVELLAVVAVARMKMLPGILIFVMSLVFVLYDGLLFFFMFLRGRKVPKNMIRRTVKKRRIIACVLAIVMICGCVVISKVANDVRKTFESVQAQQQQEAIEEVGITRSVFVRVHDVAQELKDAQDYTFGIIEGYDDECTQQAITAIETQLGTTIKTQSYLSAFEMADSLLSGKLNAMILNGGYVSILEEDDRYAMFTDSTRVLADVKIEGTGEELDGSGLLMNAEADIAENGKLKPFIMYVSGSDSRSGVLDGKTRSDVNILVVVHPETRQVLLLNTPRDYLVSNPHGNGELDKLAHCGVWGIGNSVGALETLYECDVQYYAQINFSGFEKMIDAIGGITVHSDVEFQLYRNPRVIKKGENELNGKDALAFARTRKPLNGGDNDRGKNQMKVIKAILEKATSGTTIITNYSAIMESIDGTFVMNVPMSLVGELVKKQLADMSGWNIQTYASTGKGSSAVIYSSQGLKQYIMRPNEESVAKAKELIKVVLDGQTLTDEVMKG